MFNFRSIDIKKFFFVIAHWERWHYHVKYIPLYPVWMWYCVRARSFWWFTPSNPTLTFGGFEGESKSEMYRQLPPGSYPNSIYLSSRLPFGKAESLVKANNFKYPFAVKPDVGMMGFMFRKMSNHIDFRNYHETIGVDYILQEFIEYPLEVSVFYYRFPGKATGTITGFIKKEFPDIRGDGKSTLLQLLVHHPVFCLRLNEWKLKHAERLLNILPDGELFRLSQAANLSRGGKLISLAHEKDEKLLKVFDDLSQYAKHFYYGRYDIKCSSVGELKEGKNFSILEYNGCGAEPHHIYGNNNNLLQAYKIVLQHWNVLYRISKYNRTKGIEYWKCRKGYTFLMSAKKHFARLKKLDVASRL